jgi:cytochrome c
MRRVSLALLVLWALSGCGKETDDPRWQIPGANPERGRAAIVGYGCASCHVVPGVGSAQGLVGPPLVKFAHRAYIAGRLPNLPDSLVHWIMEPQRYEPGSAMPNMGVTEHDARDIAAYLYTLR